MSSEGGREIEAARKRLVAAKAQASAASTVIENLEKSMETAKSMKVKADKEVMEAKQMLADAEKRWEVIAIDIDNERGFSGRGK